MTRWSRFDANFSGVHWRELAKLVRPKPSARFVVAHAEQGFTSNVPLEFLDDDIALLATRGGRRAAHAGARLAAPARDPRQVLLEEREVAPRHRARARRTSPASGSATGTTTTPTPGAKSATASRRFAQSPLGVPRRAGSHRRGRRMRHFILAVAAFGAAAMFASVATADVKITDQTYVRHDGGTDVTIASCNNDSPGVAAGGERQQNEPTAAIDPMANTRMTAGLERLLLRADDHRRVRRLLLDAPTAARTGPTACCPDIRPTRRPRAATATSVRSTASSSTPATRCRPSTGGVTSSTA